MADGDSTASKRCSKCGCSKPTTEFGKQAIRKDGLNPWCKACKSVTSKDYYGRNAERLKPIRQIWNTENAESLRKYRQRYYQANRIKHDGLTRRWAAQHPERHREIARDCRRRLYAQNPAKDLAASKRWRLKNAEMFRASGRRYRIKNPEKIRATRWNYKARKRAAQGYHSGADIQLLFLLQRGQCAYCQLMLGNRFHVDHITPLSKGGSNWPTNLQLLCQKCNLEKGAKLPHEYARHIGRLL